MVERQKSKILAKYSLGSRVSQEEVEAFSTSNRLLSYNKREGKIEISYNEDYAQTLKAKFTEVIKFYTKYYVLEEIFLDICRLKEIVEIEKNNALQYLEKSLNDVDHRIDELKNGINEARKTEKKILEDKKSRNSKHLTENHSNDIQKITSIGIKSDKIADKLINSTRFNESKEASEMAELQEIFKIFPENIKLLQEQKDFLLSDMKKNFETNFGVFIKMFNQIGEYYQQAQRISNPLETNIEYDHEDFNISSSLLVPCLQQLHKTRLILFSLEQEVILRDKLISINDKIGHKKIEIAGQNAAQPYLDASIESCTKIYKESRGRYIANVTNDRVDHMSYCIKEVNNNIDMLTSEINSIQVTMVPPRTVIVSTNARQKVHTSPDAFQKCGESLAAEEEMLTTNRTLNEYVVEKNKLPQSLNELQNLEMIKGNFFLEKSANYEEKNQMYLNIAETYIRLLAIITENTALHYDSSMLVCLLGVLIKYINFVRKPGCCSCGSVDDYLAVDMTLTQLFKTLTKILGKGKKVKTGCCSGNDLSKAFNCKSIDLNDFIELLLDVRVVGALMADDGGKQKVSNKKRTELINQSIVGSVKELIHVHVLQHQYLYQVNMKRAVENIKTYETSFIETVRHLNYMEIAHKSEHHKLLKK